MLSYIREKWIEYKIEKIIKQRNITSLNLYGCSKTPKFIKNYPWVVNVYGIEYSIDDELTTNTNIVRIYFGNEFNINTLYKIADMQWLNWLNLDNFMFISHLSLVSKNNMIIKGHSTKTCHESIIVPDGVENINILCIHELRHGVDIIFSNTVKIIRCVLMNYDKFSTIVKLLSNLPPSLEKIIFIQNEYNEVTFMKKCDLFIKKIRVPFGCSIKTELKQN